MPPSPSEIASIHLEYLVEKIHLYIDVGLLIMKTLSCREAGFDCDYVVKGETEEEIFKNGAQHAMQDHGMKEEDITSEFKEKLRGLIKTT